MAVILKWASDISNEAAISLVMDTSLTSGVHFSNSISLKNQRLIADAIDGLAVNPRPSSSKLLRKAENLRRLTVGDYRVIYGIEEGVRTVTVEAVRHRSVAYLTLSALAITVRSKRYSRDN
ncbi:MAG: hypothetical protein NVS1B11_21750 [Terriglobales bacterium]